MIWAAISADGSSDILRFNGYVTSRRYVAEALQPALIPFVNQHKRQMTFMNDNAHRHRAHTSGAGTKQHTCFGPWPSKSPDMNQIENLWAQLQRAIDNRPNRPQMRHNSEELFKKNGETSTCGIIGSYFFRCSVDAQHLCRLQGDIQNIDNAFCYISVILWKHIEHSIFIF